ncbi:biopolymer transport ExbD protein [Flavobacterium saliperosum S13]|uniref:Biopolymer transport protein ExbD n=2 Tax=Flavobacterium saliperosum TaxID=329186 RepID=A0A1G4VV18_9FLAO|nr:biopolymer transporter ExbD [Flavobacterium saliperosum]ESU27137.1 biopolymer transport ExbD protein [Flavobacterium saliperosum S13]SCX12380.1 Biopolymer transport protein ExbD [Flavobacterium saliperosum]
MAELNTGGGGGKKKGHVRSKKQDASVDLTAMVDLAFLLITFFMLTTSLSKPQSMNLAMPDKTEDQTEKPVIDVADDRTMTLLLGEKNQIVWYYGLPDSPIEGPTKVGYGKNGIRKELLEKEKTVLSKYGDPKKGLIVLIKASKKSTYRNLVDVLDEMAIAKVPTYAIVDITPEENAMLEKEGLYTK